MLNKKLACIGATALAISTGGAEAALLTNGGFELPGGAGQNYAASSELGTHDFVGPSFGDVDPTGWTRSGSRIWYMTDAGDDEFPEGDYAVRFDSRDDLGGIEVLSQSVSLNAGTRYTLTFDFWAENPTGARINVDLTGPDTISALSDYFTNGADGVVENVSVNFTPTVSGNYSLGFSSSANGNDHAWIDNATLVPEPASLALVGLGGLLALNRQKRREL